MSPELFWRHDLFAALEMPLGTSTPWALIAIMFSVIFLGFYFLGVFNTSNAPSYGLVPHKHGCHGVEFSASLGGIPTSADRMARRA